MDNNIHRLPKAIYNFYAVIINRLVIYNVFLVIVVINRHYVAINDITDCEEAIETKKISLYKHNCFNLLWFSFEKIPPNKLVFPQRLSMKGSIYKIWIPTSFNVQHTCIPFGAVLDGFIRLDLPAKTIPSSNAKSTLFHPKEHFVWIMYKHQCKDFVFSHIAIVMTSTNSLQQKLMFTDRFQIRRFSTENPECKKKLNECECFSWVLKIFLHPTEIFSAT